MISAAFPAGSIRGCNERFDLSRSQERHDCSLKPLLGDGEYSLDECGLLWVPKGGVTEQGAHRGEPCIPGPGTVVPVGFEVVEEGGNDWFLQVLQSQLVRCPASPG